MSKESTIGGSGTGAGAITESATRGAHLTIITPRSRWWRLPVGELVGHSELLWLLVHRDFVAKYKQTVLGPTWFVIQPLATAIAFAFVFGRVAKLPTDSLPQLLFYLSGMLSWQYFSQSVEGVSSTFTGSAHLFNKVYFPRLVIPLSVVASNLLALGVQLVSFLGFWAYFKFFTTASQHFHMDASVVLFPVLVVSIAAVALGVGLWMCALAAKYRDALHGVRLLMQLWLYATPIAYPISMVPSEHRWLYALNPMCVPVEMTRYMFLGKGTITPTFLIVFIVMTVLLLITGAMAFRYSEGTFVDTV